MKQLNLAQYLKKRSREICKDNGCAKGEHNCESYAYINAEMQLMDICCSDFFQGSSKPYAAIPLPWTGGMRDLKAEVTNQCAEMAE